MRYGPFKGALSLAAILIFLLMVPLEAWAAPDPAAIQAEMNRTAAEYGRLESERARTEQRIGRLELDLQKANETLSRKGQLIKSRAAYLYKSGGVGPLFNGLVLADDLHVFLRRLQLLEMTGSKDSELVEGIRITQARASEIREQLDATKRQQASVISQLKNKQRQLEAAFQGAKGAAKVSRFGNFESFTLPMSPSAFANTWGAPRSGGRRHQGTDIMAPCGAPVVAVTNGVISDLSSGGNGGIMAYLRAPNGDVFFYAHLRGYAAGVSVGKRVSTGDLIAYNGNTGNARGGPCHIHFEWHPDGGRPVNPYPLLAAAR